MGDVRLWLQLALVIAALAAGLVPLDPVAVERLFSAGVYPPIQRLVTPITNVAPFALFDWLIASAGVAVVTALAGGIRRARRARSLRPLARTAGSLVAAGAGGYLVFLAVWGFNYRRVPMAERLVLEREAPTTDAVVALGAEAVARINGLHADAHRIGWPGPPWRNDQLRSAFAGVQQRLSDAPLAVPGRLKWSIFGPYFRWTSVDGMVNPFALEVLENPDLLPFERPMIAAHEWAHLAGYANESEANLVGWLTCVRADVPSQYSAWLHLYWQIAGELGRDHRARLWDAVAEGPRRDIDAIVERIRRGQLPMLRAASWRVYDQYLRANRVEEGIRSYDEVITLILRARFDEGWTPVRRSVPSR
jgi:hypothetical protein